MKKVCVIGQPTFLPWVGWFDLADQADVLVILDDVAFSKQSWQQRNRIRTRNGLEFLTVPVKTAGRLGQAISECELADQPFIGKMLKTIRANYSRAPFFADAIDEFETTMETVAGTGRLVELNCALISWMAGRLRITTPMVRATALAVSGQRGEHVASICERVGASRYLSPVGAATYLREDKLAFDQRGISVWLHAFEHPEYAQCFKPFVPFASALDLIFNVGPVAIDVIRSGRRPATPLAVESQCISKESA